MGDVWHLLGAVMIFVFVFGVRGRLLDTVGIGLFTFSLKVGFGMAMTTVPRFL